MELQLPEYVKEIIAILEKNGYQAYVVGGAIRDTLLNLPVHDYDLTVNDRVEEISKLFTNFRVVSLNQKHQTIILHFKHHDLEITSFRGGENDLKSDLLKRDFTINSLAYSLKEGIIDYSEGIKDLKEKMIRLNQDNEDLLKDDPLRILRAIRFSSKLNFFVEQTTKQLLFKNKELLKKVAVERIREEFNKIILSKNPSAYLREYFSIFVTFLPEIEKMKEFDQKNSWHYQDLLEHTFTVLDHCKENLALRLAALFHDIGKLATQTIDENGQGHYFNHPQVSETIAKEILNRLKYDNETKELVLKLIRYHDYDLASKKSIKKALKIFDNKIELLYCLMDADRNAHVSHTYCHLEIEEIREMTKKIIHDQECFNLKGLEIKGIDLVELGLEGKQINMMLTTLLNLVVKEKLANKKAALLAKAKEIISANKN